MLRERKMVTEVDSLKGMNNPASGNRKESNTGFALTITFLFTIQAMMRKHFLPCDMGLPFLKEAHSGIK